LNAEKTAIIVEGKYLDLFFLIFAPDVDHLVWCEPDVKILKMSKLDNDGKAMISIYLSILITEINIYSGRH
jgi:hypothetical protein